MLAEYVLLEESGTVKLPAHFSLAEGATLPCAGLTAWHAVVEHGNTKAGQTVLVQGTGGVRFSRCNSRGCLARRWLRPRPATKKLAKAKELGAAHGINYKSTPEWDKAAVEITRAASTKWSRSAAPARSRGSLGADQERWQDQPDRRADRPGGRDQPNADPRQARQHPGHLGRLDSDVRGRLNRAISVNGMKPAIDKVFPFADAKAAFNYLKSAAHFGKVVIALPK